MFLVAILTTQNTTSEAHKSQGLVPSHRTDALQIFYMSGGLSSATKRQPCISRAYS